MADYREISQEYARHGINAAFLLNGGAAVALLSQASALKLQGMSSSIAIGLGVWAAGTALAAATWIIAFVSTRYVDKSEREKTLEKKHLRTSDRWMMAGTLTLIGAIVLFGVGCATIASAFISKPDPATFTTLVEKLLPFTANSNAASRSMEVADIFTRESVIAFGAALAGAVAGALVAGAIQFYISKKEFDQERSMVADAALQLEKTLALSLGVKAITINNQMYTTIGMVMQMLAAADNAGHVAEPLYTKIMPISGLAERPVQFSSEEIALLFDKRESELANRVMLLNERNRSTTESVIVYSKLRSTFVDVVASKNEFAIDVRRKELSDIANQICVALSEDSHFAVAVMDEMMVAFRRIFKEDFLSANMYDGGAERLNSFTEYLKTHNH